MVSAALLAHKAKQIDDGLYAAVELSADAGAGKLRGKAALLAGLVERLAKAKPEPAVATVLGAAWIGSAGIRLSSDAMAEAVRTVVARFEQNPASKPLGFYTWSPDLERIFRRDHLLQQELEGAAGISAIVEAICADADLRTAYAAHLDLAAKLTNALAPDMPDLRGFLATPGKEALARGVWFFPPSRAHETDLVQRMYGDSPIPAGFSLVSEVLRRVRAGTLDLAPTATSGWYDWQTWALETLAAPTRAPEAKKLRLSSAYEAWLEDLFRGLFALTRETHIKQLELPCVGAAMRGRPRREINIRPDLRVEPLPTFYLRRALAYRFVRGVLEAAFGERELSNMRRLRADGPVDAPLAGELRDIEALFLGAYTASMADLGLPPDADPAAAAALPAFLAWRGKLANDPDLSVDARMMVPLFYDQGRGKTKVLAFLGWTERRIEASFATPPRVEVREPDVDVRFGAQHDQLAYPVTAEVYVSRLLDRGEMRALCDAKKTRSAIIAALQG
ncbi:Hypothetical protein A7982_01101 [Minicystis rosea]|nr:Hypothetical protein A7982_01101 [Minicystis rosea]